MAIKLIKHNVEEDRPLFHDLLNNRSLPNQHPISSITGLSEAIENVNQSIADTDTKIDSEITNVNAAVNGLESDHNRDINNLRSELTSDIDNKYNELNDKIEGFSTGTIDDWKVDTEYIKNQPIYCEGKLYRAKLKHTSRNTFEVELAFDKWELISTTSSGGSSGGDGGNGINASVEQITKINVIAPKEITLSTEAQGHKNFLPHVLVYESGIKELQVVSSFNNGSEDSFNYNEEFVEFKDGIAKLKTEKVIETNKIDLEGDNLFETEFFDTTKYQSMILK